MSAVFIGAKSQNERERERERERVRMRENEREREGEREREREREREIKTRVLEERKCLADLLAACERGFESKEKMKNKLLFWKLLFVDFI